MTSDLNHIQRISPPATSSNHGDAPVESARIDSAARELTGSEILWESVIEHGVDVVFGYPGGAIMPAYDALPKYPQLHHVLVRHEQGAAHMADGYARASGKVGVCVATSGPGATNLTTGIANAMLDSIPMVAITGQVGSSLLGSDAFQEIDITGVTLPITKHNFLVTQADEIAATIKQAFHIAAEGRPGPVVVDITKDALQKTALYRWDPTPARMRGFRAKRLPVPEQIGRAIEMIHAAKRPMIFAGQGVIQAGATSLLLEFVRRSDIPVAATLLGLGGFPASHPRALGMMGMHGEAWVNKAIQESDLIIALGMRFDDRVTGNLKTYAPNAKKIHVELDPAEVNKNVVVDLPIIADIKEALRLLVPNVETRDRSEWLDHIHQLRGDSAVIDIQSMSDNGKLYAAHVIHDLWRITDGKAIIVSDVGQHQMWEAQYYRHDYPRKLITSGGLGTMGFALPAAIGARFACPSEEVWVIVGDGGFQMTQAELQTLTQEGLKVNIAVINNGYLGMVRQWQEFFYNRRYVSTPMTSPDFVKIAEAHGHLGIRVTQRSELRAAVEQARNASATALIDFRVEQEDS
ncbi:MAG TPA: biosynthetic-type acetolactate synthase large subunit, partial [Polyangiaceae bacterium]|nr:biosynthetic-type acetolactate synthase large subunit [Polyangiaceae bacterium]